MLDKHPLYPGLEAQLAVALIHRATLAPGEGELLAG